MQHCGDVLCSTRDSFSLMISRDRNRLEISECFTKSIVFTAAVSKHGRKKLKMLWPLNCGAGVSCNFWEEKRQMKDTFAYLVGGVLRFDKCALYRFFCFVDLTARRGFSRKPTRVPRWHSSHIFMPLLGDPSSPRGECLTLIQLIRAHPLSNSLATKNSLPH